MPLRSPCAGSHDRTSLARLASATRCDASPALLKAIETEKDEWVRDAILSALSSLDPDFDEEPYED